jgi:predicted ATPase/DNA-binding XRE family transcriptional regulator
MEASETRPFGRLLTDYRCAAGLTQEALAERAGLSTSAISLLERGARTSPRHSTLAVLAEALRLSPNERRVFVAAARLTTAPAAVVRIPPELRMPPTPLVGRERMLEEVLSRLARPDVRLLTLTGAPGSGKTRLAMAVATAPLDGYRDGVHPVALGSLADPALVMTALRQALGLREPAGETALQTLAAHCRDRRLLLVLDNFEHLLPAAPELVELLAVCPGLQALATSRAPLRVRMEHELPVPPLALPGAGEERPAALMDVASVSLFVDRAREGAPGFRLTAENAGAVAAVCRCLDGLPLAIELAAPWIRLLTPDGLRERLDRRLELLVDGPRDLPERQRTLRAALAWSCELLPPEPHALLRRLSVFAGSAPMDLVEDVCQAAGPLPSGTLRHLATLVDHSLVQRLQPDAGELRVTLLESVREFGRELLAEAGETESTALAHLEAYAEVAERAGDSDKERPWRELDNVRAALGWAVEHGRTGAGLRLAGALRSFWTDGGHRREGLAWLERLLAAGGAVDPAVRARGLQAAGFLAAQVGAGAVAAARHRESAAIFRDLGDQRGVAEALRGLGQVTGREGRYAEAVVLFDEAIGLLRELDERSLLVRALNDLGAAVAQGGGDPRRAFEEALAVQRDLDDELVTALCLINLGNQDCVDGNLELAQSRLEEASSIARRLEAPYHLAAALATLGWVDRARGDHAAALGHYRESLPLFARLGEPFGVANCLRSLAWLAWTDGRAALAARYYGAADALCPGVGAEAGDERRMHEDACAALRAHLGDDRFEAAREAGGRLSLEDAAAEAADPGQGS